jgi:hypothetical protein
VKSYRVGGVRCRFWLLGVTHVTAQELLLPEDHFVHLKYRSKLGFNFGERSFVDWKFHNVPSYSESSPRIPRIEVRTFYTETPSRPSAPQGKSWRTRWMPLVRTKPSPSSLWELAAGLGLSISPRDIGRSHGSRTGRSRRHPASALN